MAFSVRMGKNIPPGRFEGHRRFCALKPRLLRLKNSPCPETFRTGIFVMLCVLRRQRRAYDIRGFEFALRVKVRINVARRTDIAVAEPFLGHLHRHLFREQKRGAGMPQLVKPDMPESVFLHALPQDSDCFIVDEKKVITFGVSLHERFFYGRHTSRDILVP